MCVNARKPNLLHICFCVSHSFYALDLKRYAKVFQTRARGMSKGVGMHACYGHVSILEACL